ncbi:exonuclease [Cloacibacterium rupense]|uniref:Exonuclease n=1 Tax=Cloacibacterium rupense TaxID=517423 RepID=A0ABQ2NL13_9FLAO|nr:3'-5' exonuclease [Cloacibacterium rupense]GGP03896.1 exonuclease [Cloacibacterium rupense]
MYTIIDIESNGAGYRKESIIEVAIFRYDGHTITDQFISLVNPESDITPFVQKLTKITPKMVKSAPKFHEIAKRIIEITDGTTLVGHNIDFDYRMLRQSFKRLGYEFKINTLDTIPLAKKLIPDQDSYSLGKLCKSIGIPLIDEHRASGDARATLELFKLLKTKDNSKEIIQQHHEESNAKNYINKIKELTQDLPSEKGFLYFQNASGAIIFEEYVDDLFKVSKKIFNSKSKKFVEIQNEVEQITYELTGTDTIAKLVLINRNKSKKQFLPYGLFYKNDKYLVDKNSKHQEKPILKFKNFSQGNKVKNYINQDELLKNHQLLEKTISLKNRNEIWIGKGRNLGEKSFLILEKGKLIGFGYYELYHQIQSREKLNKLQIEVKKVTPEITNELKLSLLKKEYEIVQLPEK